MGMLECITEIREQEGLQKGERKGRQAERRRIVKRLLGNKRLSVKEIAAIVEVSVAFVESVRGRKKRTV